MRLIHGEQEDEGAGRSPEPASLIDRLLAEQDDVMARLDELDRAILQVIAAHTAPVAAVANSTGADAA